MRSTRDGEQTTTTLAKRILYVLLLPWNLNVLTAYLGDFKLHTFQYAEYYGDADDKSFSRVDNVYQASGITVKKKDCIGHVQKRVGTALRKLKRENPGFGGADRPIDTLQHYYGIFTKCGQFDRNEKAIHAHASLMHCASNKSRSLHNHCPTGSTSWCKYHKDKANKTKLHKHGLVHSLGG